MRYKQIIGVVLIIVGVLGIVLSQYIKSRVTEEVGSAKDKTSRLTNNSLADRGGRISKKVGKSIDEKIDEKGAAYNTMIAVSLYGGIACIIVGGFTVFLGRRRG